uniref:Uncharacterized protein n=1 Tax=Anguilla anguilla TaxID=7936 RepID=A0A0E9RRW4_ANGAN
MQAKHGSLSRYLTPSQHCGFAAHYLAT